MRARLLITAAAAVVTLGCAVTPVAARRLQLSHRAFRDMTASLWFVPVIETRVTCPITIEGSLHSATFDKVAGALIGLVTRVAFSAAAACTGGSVSVLSESLPWHIAYRGFLGRLPRPDAMLWDIRNAALSVRLPSSIMCLLISSAARPWVWEITANGVGTIFSIRQEPSSQLVKSFGSISCRELAEVGGIGPYTALGSETAVTLTLI